MADFRPSQVTGDIDVSANASQVGAVGAETLVGDSTLTTVVTLTANGLNHITRISCSGQQSGKWEIYLDTVLTETKRSAPGLNVEFLFDNPLAIVSGTVVDVKVTHYMTGENSDFDATIYGFAGV